MFYCVNCDCYNYCGCEHCVSRNPDNRPVGLRDDDRYICSFCRFSVNIMSYIDLEWYEYRPLIRWQWNSRNRYGIGGPKLEDAKLLRKCMLLSGYFKKWSWCD